MPRSLRVPRPRPSMTTVDCARRRVASECSATCVFGGSPRPPRAGRFLATGRRAHPTPTVNGVVVRHARHPAGPRHGVRREGNDLEQGYGIVRGATCGGMLVGCPVLVRWIVVGHGPCTAR